MAESELVLPISTLLTSVGLGGAALHRAGKLEGRVEAVAERADKLEAKQDRNVSREELDARFEALDQKIDTVIRLLEAKGS